MKAIECTNCTAVPYRAHPGVRQSTLRKTIWWTGASPGLGFGHLESDSAALSWDVGPDPEEGSGGATPVLAIRQVPSAMPTRHWLRLFAVLSALTVKAYVDGCEIAIAPGSSCGVACTKPGTFARCLQSACQVEKPVTPVEAHNSCATIKNVTDAAMCNCDSQIPSSFHEGFGVLSNYEFKHCKNPHKCNHWACKVYGFPWLLAFVAIWGTIGYAVFVCYRRFICPRLVNRSQEEEEEVESGIENSGFHDIPGSIYKAHVDHHCQPHQCKGTQTRHPSMNTRVGTTGHAGLLCSVVVWLSLRVSS